MSRLFVTFGLLGSVALLLHRGLLARQRSNCYGLTRQGPTDLPTARELIRLARQMSALADSSRAVLTNQIRIGGFEDPTREFWISAADVAGRAEAFAPNDQMTLLTAARLYLRAATLGEARLDTVLGLRAECFATRASGISNNGRVADSARTLLRDIQTSLEEERRAAAQDRRPR